MTSLKDIVTKSVFRSIVPGTAMNDILAIIFHRLSATVYGFYGLWAIISVIDGIPSVIRAEGEAFQFWFSLLIFLTATPACAGAAFWPNLARLELFSGAGFAGLIGFYMYVLLRNVLEADGSWAGWFLIWSIMVLPVCRTIVVILLLLRQERDRKVKIHFEPLGDI